MVIGVVAFSNDGGLGNQTKRLVYMLKPDRLLVIDATPFSKNKQNHTEWFKGFSGYTVHGFPSDHEINVFLKGLTHVLLCENPLNFHLYSEARARGIKVYCQSNYEFCDNLNNRRVALPHKFLMPSYWHVKTMKDIFGENMVTYLPPPIDPNEFKEARQANLNRSDSRIRFLHVVGTLAVHDRNGTLDLLDALKYTSADFELVIRSQHPLPQEYVVNDHRVKYVIENASEPSEMYKDYDAIIIPRRYGGLSLCTNEALMSALPVLMPAISPNSELLPEQWLYPAERIGDFLARTMIDIYKSDTRAIAAKMGWLVNLTPGQLDAEKLRAFDLGHSNFSFSVLSSKYEEIWSQ